MLRRWDGDNGRLLFEAPAAGGGRPSVSTDGHVLVADPRTHSVTVVDPIIRGELGTIRFCGTFVPGGSLVVRGDTIAVNSSDCDGSIDGPTTLASAETLERRRLAAQLSGPGARRLARRAHGRASGHRRTLGHAGGPVGRGDRRAPARPRRDCRWDISRSDDNPRFETDPSCREYPESPFPMWLRNVAWTPDSRLVALVDNYEAYAGVWDAATGRLVHAFDELGNIQSTVFSPDGKRLIVSRYDGQLVAFDTTTWKEIASNELGVTRLVMGGFLADGHTLIAISGLGDSGGGSLLRIDGETLELLGVPTRAHDGSPKAIALSPDHRLVATSASDGVARVWDGATGELLHEVQVLDQAQGVAFLDESGSPSRPKVETSWSSRSTARSCGRPCVSSLTRGFTPEECQRFEFSPCPTLEELRGD